VRARCWGCCIEFPQVSIILANHMLFAKNILERQMHAERSIEDCNRESIRTRDYWRKVGSDMRQTSQPQVFLRVCGVEWLAESWMSSKVPRTARQMFTSPTSVRQAVVRLGNIVAWYRFLSNTDWYWK
jgi:hypothetical protein